VSALRAAVSAHAVAAGLSKQRVYKVPAAVRELAANAVLHGAQLSAWHPYGHVDARNRTPIPAISGPAFGRAGPAGQRTLMASSTARSWGLSPRCPAVITTDRGFWPCSQARWILVVRPPRDRPIP
jgi:hypothetical protein